MSARRLRTRLSNQAALDYDDILLWSLLEFGEVQMVAYQAKLDRALQRLTRFPSIGTLSEVRHDGTRQIPVGSHVMYFRRVNDEIEVLRLLHHHQQVRTGDLDV